MHNIRRWINLVEARRRKQPDDELSRLQRQWKAEDDAADAEARNRAKYKGKFDALEQAAEAIPDNDLRFRVTSALSAGTENADDTEGHSYNSANYWRVALDSIAQTADFNEHREVRDWFESQGYQW